MKRSNRKYNELRNITITPNVNCWAESSVQITAEKTSIICTASVSESIPKWLMQSNSGWLTAEYGMLPHANNSRITRLRSYSSGRTQEISRLIGRSLRTSIDLTELKNKQIQIDCDVLQADGGTRTACITGGFVTLALCLKSLKQQGVLNYIPLKHYVAAISVGLNEQDIYLDLDLSRR